MKEKIKILLSLLLVALFAVACSKKKSDNMGLLALLLLGDDSSSSSSSATTKSVDVSQGFPSELHSVIAYTKAHDHSSSVSLAGAPDSWKRIKDQTTVDLAKNDEIEFAIVPKTGTIPEEDKLIVIGSYKKPNDNEGVKLSFTSLKSAAAGSSPAKLTEKQAMAFVAVAHVVEKESVENAKKILEKTTAANLKAIVKAAGDISGDDLAAKVSAIKAAIDTLDTEVLTTGNGLNGLKSTASGSKAAAVKSGAGGANGIAAKAAAAIDKASTGTPPATGDKPTATLTIAENQNATTSVNTVLSYGVKEYNGSQTIKIVASSTNLTSPVYFLYTATEEGTKSITPQLLTNVTKSTAVKMTAATIDGYINFTSSYVYTLAACKTGTTKPDANCAYSDTKKVNWKPTVVLKDKTVIEDSAKFAARYKKDGTGLDSVKLNLASVLAGEVGGGGWTILQAKGNGGYWGKGTVGITDPTNITISQVYTGAFDNFQGTLTVTGGDSLMKNENKSSQQNLASEIKITNYYVPQTGLGATAMSNVSGTVRVTACSAYAPPAGCVSVDVVIDGDTSY